MKRKCWEEAGAQDLEEVGVENDDAKHESFAQAQNKTWLGSVRVPRSRRKARVQELRLGVGCGNEDRSLWSPKHAGKGGANIKQGERRALRVGMESSKCDRSHKTTRTRGRGQKSDKERGDTVESRKFLKKPQVRLDAQLRRSPFG